MNTDFASARVYSNLQGLAELKLAANQETPEALKEVAAQFEALFIQMMLKSMRDATLSSDLFGSSQMQLYQDMFDKQVSMDLAGKHNFGIADVLIRQLGGQTAAPKEDVTAKQMPISQSAIQSRLANLSARQAAVNEVVEDKHFETPEDFIQALRPMAEEYAKQIGVKPEVLIAQSALETGWGKKIIRSADGRNSHNLFGIKANNGWSGSKVSVKTLEYLGETFRNQRADFRSYDSFQQSFADYVDFIQTNPRYQNALMKAHDAKAYMRELQAAGYATDPKYADKVISIMQTTMI